MWSAPESLIDFASSDGGGNSQSTDSFLQTRYTGIRQSNGYLYFFGDGVGRGGLECPDHGLARRSPRSTTRTSTCRPACRGGTRRQDFGRSMLFGNETGIYGLYGGAVTKVSQKLDKLFDVALFPPTGGALTPSGAIATIHNVKHYLNLMTIVDPDTGLPRNLMIGWNERDWTPLSQTVNLIYIGPQKVESKFHGVGHRRHFALPAVPDAVGRRWSSGSTPSYTATDQFFVMKDFMGLYVQAQDLSAGNVGINLSAVLAASGLAIQASADQSVVSEHLISGTQVLYSAIRRSLVGPDGATILGRLGGAEAGRAIRHDWC